MHDDMGEYMICEEFLQTFSSAIAETAVGEKHAYSGW